MSESENEFRNERFFLGPTRRETDNMYENSALNDEIIERYLAGELTAAFENWIEYRYDSEPSIRQMFSDREVLPFHLRIDEPSDAPASDAAIDAELDTIEQEIARITAKLDSIESESESHSADVVRSVLLDLSVKAPDKSGGSDEFSISSAEIQHALESDADVTWKSRLTPGTITQICGRSYVILQLIEDGDSGASWLASVSAENDSPELRKTVIIRSVPWISDHESERESESRQALLQLLVIGPVLQQNRVLPWCYADVSASGGAVLVTDGIDGVSLRQTLATKGRFSAQQTVAIISDIAASLDNLHRRQLCHSDIRPETILLDRNNHQRPVLIDFGLAKLRTDLLESTYGTVCARRAILYQPPEYWRDLRKTEQLDRWALACVTYEMMTGQTCFQAATPGAVIPVSYSDLWGEALQGRLLALRTVFRKAFSGNADERFPDCKTFVRDLCEALEQPWADSRPAAAQTSPVSASPMLPHMPSMPTPAPMSAMHSETVAPQPEALPPDPLPQPRRSRGHVGLLAPIGLPMGLAASITGAVYTSQSQYVEEASGIPVLVSTIESPDVPVLIAQSLGITSGLWMDFESMASRNNVPANDTDAQPEYLTRLGFTFITIDAVSPDTTPNPWKEVFGKHSVHRVKEIAISAHEVTLEQLLAVMKNSVTLPERNEVTSYFDDHSSSKPAVVSYEQAVEFCQRLSEMDSANYRLPTEAEWEFVCGRSARRFGTVRPQLAETGGRGDIPGNVWEWSDANDSHRRTDPVTSHCRAKKWSQIRVHLAAVDVETGHEPPPPGRFRVVREPVTLRPVSPLQTGRFLR
ncbi:MAG: protein kinase domain-containing protein [Planctomyces sp.]